MRRDSISRLGLICLSILLLPVIAQAHEIDRTPPADIEALQQRVAEVLEYHGVPGAGLALFNRNKVLWAGGVGATAWNGGKPVTADTRFRAGSVTKSLVAAAIMQQVEAGKLNLTARVKDIAPEVDIRNPWHNADPVLVVHLLEHSAGFDDMHFKDSYNLSEEPAMPLLAAVNHSFESLQVRWRPGSRMSYSNPGYGVAGYLLEKTAQQPFEQTIDQALFTPLDMPNSTLLFNGGRLEGLAEGYDAPYGEPVKHRAIYLRPAGNLVTTPRDLAHFGRMLLNKGVFNGKRILDADSVARMQHPESTQAAQAGLEYGYGLGIGAHVMDGIVLYGHSGGIDGFLSYYAYSPKHDFGFVVLLNASHSGVAIRETARILLAYLAADAVPEYPAVANIDKTQLLDYAGYYRDASPRNEVMHFMSWLLNIAEVRVVDGKLILDPLFGQTSTLVPVGNGLFRPQNAPLATIVVLD
ncbi:MAG TPA: serine hydrolase domain-containing protein, partial [Gammaproteobacteria bacterium]|nr:serine hydrolase domain-containing protein [Gammaproteobacteria bacterium]